MSIHHHSGSCFTSGFLLAALEASGGVTLLGRPAELSFLSLCSDTRLLSPGALFVALKGDRYDGHDFIPAALARGAAGVLCERMERQWLANHSGTQFFLVKHVLHAYRAIAGAWRRRFDIPVFAVAGSTGKTSTKELLAALLRGRYRKVLKTPLSQNGFTGIPTTLLELRPAHDAAVIEIGIDEIGAMAQHLDLVMPDFSVVTAVGPEHLEKFGDIGTAAAEEALALIRTAEEKKGVAINADQPFLAPLTESLSPGKGVIFTMRAKVPPHRFPFQVLKGKWLLDPASLHQSLQVSGLGDPVSFAMPLPGKHNASNLLAAIAAARLAGLESAEMMEGLRSLSAAQDVFKGRSQMRRLYDGTPVLCDYYNANPVSMEAAFALLQLLGKKPRWACLGDMLELGREEEAYHRRLIQPLRKYPIQHLLLYGPRMKFLADELNRKDYQGHVLHFRDQGALLRELMKQRSAGEAILIKGSRGMKMESVWEALSRIAGPVGI